MKAAVAQAADFRALFEAAPGLYLVLSPDLTILGASDAYLRATMTEREAIVGHNLYEIFPDNPESDEHALGSNNLRASLQRVLARHEPDLLPIQRYDVRLPASEGGAFTTRYWSPCNLPVLSPSGELRWILHCVEDVTGFVQLLGREAPGLVSPPPPPEDDPRPRLEQTHFSMTRLARGLNQHVAQRTQELEAANRRLESELAERQRLEEQFRQAQKMEAVGRLAGGVAHDFNNILTVIQGYGEMLVQGERDPARQRKLEQMLRAADRAASLTRQLLAFSRQQMLQLQVLDLNAIVRDTATMLQRMIGDDIELITVPSPQPAYIKADAGQIEQVLMNLAVNARDAMPSGGRLTIETARVQLDAAYSGRRGAAVQPGPYIMLAVTDTGAGMDAAVREHIFDPFFTTKDVNKGTGLGLATVYGVVQQSGGNIWVYSEPGRGACFKIYLPSAAEEAIEAAPEGAPAADAGRGGETVLLVEDETAVRELIRVSLEEQGYKVLAASSAEHGLPMLEAHGPVDLLLTDLVMPGRSGRELAEAVAARSAGTRVLYMSGYTDDVVMRQGVIADGMPFLQKPFRPTDLLARVRQVLDGAG